MTAKAGFTLVGMLVGLTALEALAYLRGGVFEWTAARLWLVMALGFVALAGREVAAAAADAARRRDPLPIVMALVIGYAALWGIGGVDQVQLQHEATLEVAAGLDRWAEPALGYTGIGHLHYPARQYLIVAAPALVFGRSILCLRLGFALAVVFGALVFWAGAARAWRRLPWGPTTATLVTISVFSFPYAVKHLHWYEQTTLPLAFTLAAAGWLLVAAERPTAANLLGLTWIGGLLGTSYTPSLAAWCLLLAALAWLGWRARPDQDAVRRLGFIAVFLAVGLVGVLSFLTRRDLFRGGTGTLRPEPLDEVAGALSIFVLGTPAPFIAPLLVLPVLLTLGLGLGGRLGLPGFALSWWTVAVVVAAVVLAGYGVRLVEVEMHRAQVVIPPLLLLVGWAALRWDGCDLGHRSTAAAVVVLGLLVTGQALVTISAAYASYRPTIRERLTRAILTELDARGVDRAEPALVVNVSRLAELGNLDDTLRYFLASFDMAAGPDDARPPVGRAAVVIVIADPPGGGRALPSWVERGSLVPVRTFADGVVREVVLWVGRPRVGRGGR